MSKQAKKGCVPVLRFPEFREAGEWEQAKLRELAKRVTAKNRDGKVIRVLTNSAADGIVDQRDYFDKDIAIQGNLEGYFIVDKGDYVYNPRVSNLAPVGPISKNKLGTGVMSPLYSVFRFKCSDNNFYEQYFKTPHWHHYLRMISNSGARHDRMSITTDNFMDMPLPVPCNKEQEKIATCLSSLDELITAQAQKVETFKTHKKGLMQQLFPAEGETVPKLRFPEFREAGEWVLEEFSKYIVLYRGSSPRPIQNYLTTDSSGVNWIKIGDTKYAENFVINQVEDRITPEGAKKSRKVNVGELILANSMSYGKTYQLAIAGYIYDGWFVLRDYEKHFDKQFLLQLLNSEYMQKQYERLSAGGIVQNISSDIVYKTILPNTSIEEQEKIAACLSSLDELIAAQAQKLNALKTHKKGLMQQLFPAVDEVNA